MLVRRLSLLLGLLVACAVPRPEEAYDPQTVVDEDDDVVADFVQDAGPPTSRPVGPRDSGPKRSPSEMKPEAPEPDDAPPAAKSPLEALTGYYLMRMDLYSRWETNRPVRTRVRNRISNLLFVDVVVEDGKLVGYETICDQTYQHQCETGCTNWTTTLHRDVRKKFETLESTRREYQYDEATRELRGAMSTLNLGFDDDGKGSLPSDKADPRVWKIADGFGVYSLLSAKAVGQQLNCSVSTVQRFPTTFSGKLGEATLDGEYKLDGAPEADDIDITGGSRCTADTVDGQAPTPTKQVVRLKKVSAPECPANFDGMFPGAAP